MKYFKLFNNKENYYNHLISDEYSHHNISYDIEDDKCYHNYYETEPNMIYILGYLNYSYYNGGHIIEDPSLKKFYLHYYDIDFVCYNTPEIIYDKDSSGNNIVGGYNFFIFDSSIEQLNQFSFASSDIIFIKFPYTLKTIKDSAFSQCSFYDLKLPDNLEIVENYAFFNCNHIIDYNLILPISLPKKIKYIGDHAFGYLQFNDIYINKNVEFIGTKPFFTKNIYNIKVDPENPYYDSRNNCNAIIETSTNTLILGCSGSTIPDTVEIIGEYSFSSTNIQKIKLSNFIKKIEQYAFMGCSDLTSIEIPSGIIYEYAFSNTPLTDISLGKDISINFSSLFASTLNKKNVTINSSILLSNNTSLYTYFYNSIDTLNIEHNDASMIGAYKCNKLSIKNITIPDNVQLINNYAFSNSSLTSLNIPDNVINLGNNLIYGCLDCSVLTIGSGVKNVSYNTFNNIYLKNIIINSENPYYDSRNNCNAIIETSTNTLILGCSGSTIPDTVTSLGYYSFMDVSINNLIIPNSVTSIERYAFYNIKALSITLSNTLTTIKDYAFQNSSIPSLVIPDSVRTIYPSTFRSSKLQNLTLSNNIISIADYLCQFCSNLTSINIPANVSIIGYYAFDGCSSLTTLVIPDSVNVIQLYAFRGCSKLQSLTLPNNSSFKTIPNYMCYQNSSLASITIPYSVTSIGNYAFYSCKSLTTLVIPDSVTSIGTNVFDGCSSLTSITILAQNPPTLSNTNAFNNTNNCPIYVPAAKVSTYKEADNWKTSTIANRIQAIQS